MANNRMRLRCDVCANEFLLAKYYPTITDGWFVPTGWPMSRVSAGDCAAEHIERFSKFLEQHSYCDSGLVSMFGNRKFSLVFEEPDTPTQ